MAQDTTNHEKRALIPINSVRNDKVMTPSRYAKAIIEYFKPTGLTLEPCSGKGAFLEHYEFSDSCEIDEGKDFFQITESYDWIITNPPYSQMRAFLQKAMDHADNVVFLTTINHFWLKARIRDMEERNFGFKTILLCDTPETFPQSGFQVGVVHIRRNYSGSVTIERLNI